MGERPDSVLIFRGSLVRIESFADECRNTALNLEPRVLVPDCAKEPSRLARVLALGDGVMRNGERYEFSVAPGEIVLCNRYPKSFQSFRWNDEDVHVIREEEILAKIGGSNAL